MARHLAFLAGGRSESEMLYVSKNSRKPGLFLVALRELDDIPVRVFDECVDILAAGPIGPRSADEFHFFRFELFA